MCPETSAPTFQSFLRFVASRHGPSPEPPIPSERMLAAARAAHKELWAPGSAAGPLHRADAADGGDVEVLNLLAASSEGAARPSDLITVRGFRVRLDYRDSTDVAPSSICVLVECPQELVASVQGQIAYLWNGAERFELGEFDADGKAIGTLPAGIEITLADFTAGRIKLEAPDSKGALEPPV